MPNVKLAYYEALAADTAVHVTQSVSFPPFRAESLILFRQVHL